MKWVHEPVDLGLKAGPRVHGGPNFKNKGGYNPSSRKEIGWPRLIRAQSGGANGGEVVGVRPELAESGSGGRAAPTSGRREGGESGELTRGKKKGGGASG